DCQRLVKQALADPDLGLRTASINSINWARVATQTAYYFWAADRAGLDQASFAVPTGNFGDVFAGWVARRCGGPVARLIVANNANHGLTDLIEGRGLTVTAVEPTTAPAMDIQVPSNLERYLFELAGGNPARVRTWQETLAAVGRLELKPAEHAAMAADFTAGWLPDSEVPETIREVYESADLVLDPHTAIAWKVGERLRSPGEALITIATAHPAKFPEVVTTALGFTPALPDDLADLADRPERIHTIATDYGALRKLLAGLGSADA
ncbi:MAG TPA: threonine synthase, partial [Acidimicrobiia bacterium]